MTTPYKVTDDYIITVSLYSLTLALNRPFCSTVEKLGAFSLTSPQIDLVAFIGAVSPKAGLMENIYWILSQEVAELVLTKKIIRLISTYANDLNHFIPLNVKRRSWQQTFIDLGHCKTQIKTMSALLFPTGFTRGEEKSSEIIWLCYQFSKDAWLSTLILQIY